MAVTMRLRLGALATVALALVLLTLPVEAQQTGKPYVIGWLSPWAPSQIGLHCPKTAHYSVRKNIAPEASSHNSVI